MRGSRLRAPIATALAVVLGLAAFGATTDPARGMTDGPDGGTPEQASSGPAVTLVTGDVVSVEGGGSVTVRAATRRDGAEPAFEVRRTAATTTTPATLFVIPQDAQSLIATGRLDRNLFDVDLLRRSGFGTTAGIPVITTFGKGVRAPALRATGEAYAGSTAQRTLETVNATALAVPKDQAAAFWRDLTTTESTSRTATVDAVLQKVWLDRPVHAALDRSVAQVHAPQAWQAGYDGSGVKVAVLDTGIDSTHPDLAGKVVAARNFTSSNPAAVKDGHGHGTHVSSIVAGSGAASSGLYRGVAPGAQLLVGKVLSDSGTGLTSGLIDGIEWAALSGAQIVNMSIGGARPSRYDDGSDPLVSTIDLVSSLRGTLFVIAAGNSGPDAGTLNSPGVAASALTVGAVDGTDALAPFSSRGPLPYDYPRILKPDLVAPGVRIAAARASGTSMDTPIDPYYTRASGTSMATPHVAGAAAIVAQQHPDWTGPQLKQALTASTDEIGGSVLDRGTGRLNVERALEQAVTTTAALDLGRTAEDNAASVNRQVGYANAGAEPVTLTLSASLRDDRTGAEVPADVLTVPASVDVPANGSAAVGVSLAASRLAVGTYSGTLTATDAEGNVTRTAIGYVRDPRTVLVNVVVSGRDGQRCGVDGSCSFAEVYATNLDNPEYSVTGPAENGAALLRLRPGRYMFSANVRFVTGTETHVAVLNKPEVDVTSAQVLRLSLVGAEQVQVQTDRSAQAYGGTLLAHRRLGQVDDTNGWITGYDNSSLWALPTAPVTDGSFVLTTALDLGPVPLTGSVAGKTGFALHPRYESYADIEPKFAGWTRARLVDVGPTLEPEEAARLRGAIALTRPLYYPLPDADSCCLDAAQVKAVQDAGAIGVLVWSPDAVGRVPRAIAPQRTIPVAGLPVAEGAELSRRLAEGPVEVSLGNAPTSEYRYSLKFYEQGGVSSLRYRVTDAELARIPAELRVDGAGDRQRWAYNLAVSPQAGEGWSIAPASLVVAPTRMTQLLGPVRPGQLWSRWVRPGVDQPAAYRWSTLTPGRQPAEVWDAVPQVPGAAVSVPAGDRSCTVCRQGDTLWVRPTLTFGDRSLLSDPAMPGFYIGGSYPVVNPLQPMRTALYADDRQIAMDGTVAPSTGRYTVPAEPTVLRLVYDRDTGRQPTDLYSRALHSEWTFRSERPAGPNTAGTVCPPTTTGDCGIQPLLQVRYDVALDVRNRASRTGSTVTLTAYHESSTASPAALASMTTAVSFDDGATWVPVPVKGTGNVRSVRVPAAPSGATSISLRVEASDTAGSTVRHVLPKAYGLTG